MGIVCYLFSLVLTYMEWGVGINNGEFYDQTYQARMQVDRFFKFKA